MADQLPSWADGQAKTQILEFVRSVTEPGHGQVYRTKGMEQPVDDGPGKPVHLWTRTGRKPLLAGGHADGDAAMLRTARFGLLIRHDDAGREFAYDTGSERALAKAKERGWTVVSMQNDLKMVFDL